MRNTPAGVIIVGREECIVDGISNLHHWSHHCLSEALLNANLFKQGGTSNENNLLA